MSRSACPDGPAPCRWSWYNERSDPLEYLHIILIISPSYVVLANTFYLLHILHRASFATILTAQAGKPPW